MKKINVLATILAVAAGLTAGVAGYVVLNTRSDNTAVATVSREETVSEAASADTGEAAASGETKAAGESTAAGNAAGESTAAGNAAGENTAAGNAASPSDAAAAETAGEETVGAPDAATAAQTTSTGLDVNIAQAIHDAYVAKATSAQGDVGRGYYIYDIDKDGIPELSLPMRRVWTEASQSSHMLTAQWQSAGSCGGSLTDCRSRLLIRKATASCLKSVPAAISAFGSSQRTEHQ